MSISLIKLNAPTDSMGSENTEMASADDQGVRGYTLRDKQNHMLTLMSEPQTFSDEGTIFDSQAFIDKDFTPFTNSQKTTSSSAQPREETELTTVLQMHATERLYTNIHNHYITPEEAFEGKSRLKMASKKYIPENKFVIGTNPPLGKTSIRLYDKALSEQHASIIYRDAKRSYFTFLLCQKKINAATRSKKFPTEIHLLILSFLGEDTSYFIQDNGSRTGTYERVSPRQAVTLKNEQEFQLSMDTTIRILQVENKPQMPKFEESKKNRNMIKKFMKDGDVKIIGLEQEFSTKLTLELPSFRKNFSKDTRNLDWNSYFTFDISFLKLEVHEQRENRISKYLIFPMDGSFDYFIGRNECSDIFLSSPTCSRRHCKITYNENRRTWSIIDGAEGLPSLGGTWKSLQTTNEKIERKPSKETPVNHGSKFRLGDNVYEFLYTKKKVKLE